MKRTSLSYLTETPAPVTKSSHPQMKHPGQREIEKLRKLYKEAYLAIDHLCGLVPISAHEEFPCERKIEKGLFESYQRLLRYGKGIIQKIKDLFGLSSFSFTVYGDHGLLRLAV